MIDLRPDEKKLRQFGYIAFFGFGLVAALVAAKQGMLRGEAGPIATTIVAALAALALLSPILSLAYPAVLRFVWIPLICIAAPIGFLISHTVMALIYFLVLTPVALFFRLRGRDPMCRKFEPDAETYWVEREQVTDRKRYFRQF